MNDNSPIVKARYRIMFPLFLTWLLATGIVQAQPSDQHGEHLSPYGLPQPILLVADELPPTFENKEKWDIVRAQGNSAPPGLQFLKTPSDSPLAGKVGVYLPAEAVCRIKGRTISNAGQGAVTLRLAGSAKLAARSIALEGRRTADYNELRRCAMERAAGNPYPPATPAAPQVEQGTLVIVGGGGVPSEIAQRFLQAGGGADGHFVVLPIAMPDPVRTTQEEAFIKRMGAKNVRAIAYREKKDLEQPEVVALLQEATGIWFGGGRQWNFVDAYEGTQLPELFRGVLRRGGVIGGSSAGATIQGDYLLRGAPAGPNIMMCEGYERALGFLPGVAIDQHFSARNRFRDMTAFMAKYPQFLGIGLDEATAILVQGSSAEILGKGKVYFYDHGKSRQNGEQDYDAYPAGTTYDLLKREKRSASKTPGNK
jgi:cyanophycinase